MSITVCHVCANREPIPLFELSDSVGNPTTMTLCSRCGALLPVYSLDGLSSEEMTARQAKYHATYWSEFGPAEAAKLRDDLGGVVEVFRPLLGVPDPNSVVLELGAGRGGLLAALRHAGYRVLGCEPSADLVAKARAAYGFGTDELVHSDALGFLASLEAGPPVAHAFLWHVIEHVSEPIPLLRALARLLPPGGYLFGQGPCARVDHVFPEHLFLMTEPLIHALARNSGFVVEQLHYDHAMAFVSFVYRRTDAPVPVADAEWHPALDLPGAPIAVEAQRVVERNRVMERELAAARAVAGERMSAIDRQSEMIRDRDRYIRELQLMVESAQRQIRDEIQQRIASEELASHRGRVLDEKSRQLHAAEAALTEQLALTRAQDARILHQERMLEHLRNPVFRVREVVRRLTEK